jgi:hypothetical protein
MLALLMFSALLAVAAYFVTWKLRHRWLRVLLALVVFVTLSIPMILLIWHGDPAPPGSRTVTPEELERATRP